MKRTQMMMTALGVAAASFLVAVSPQKSMADDVKIGVILGFTGPIESLTPDMAAGAELAMKEVNDSALSWAAHRSRPCVVIPPVLTLLLRLPLLNV